MKSGKKAAALGAIVVACAPVVARATTFFTDNFDAGTSGANYDPYGADRAGGTDYRAIYNFDYGSFKYWHIAADQSTQNVGEFIPQVPRSGGAAKIGLLLDATNTHPGSPNPPDAAQIDIIPKLAAYAGGLPTGNYQMLVDV